MRPLRAAAAFALLVSCRHAESDPRLQVPMVTDEADAVLAILEERAGGRAPTESDWQRLFSSEGYRRLKQREASLQRAFEDASFKEFVLSADLLARREALARTLAEWVRVDPAAAARRAFSYLPDSAVIRARVYPAIKPKTNSFVFEPRTNPAIFLYLDPQVTPAKLENTLTHELHHIGVGSVCPDEPAAAALTGNVRTALAWMSGFAEGRAVLAAAGGPDVHPHAASEPAERSVWERDFAKVREDLPRLESFFTAILEGKLSEEEINQGMSFVSTDDVPQGAYYTVGWLMSATVERELGRKRLVASICDPAMFFRDYDRAARQQARARGSSLPLWSDRFLGRLPAERSGKSG